MDEVYSSRINRNVRDLLLSLDRMHTRIYTYGPEFNLANTDFLNNMKALAHAIKLFADLVGVIVMMRMPVPAALTPEYLTAVDLELLACLMLCTGYVGGLTTLDHVKDGMGRMATLHANGNPGFGFGQD